MGDRGRLVIPAQLREEAGLTEGTSVVLWHEDDGILLLTRDQAHERISRMLAGADLVTELVAERRTAAERGE